MAKIHPTSVVSPEAKLAEDVEIGPMCFVGPNVIIGSGTKLIAQCHIGGHSIIGENNSFYPFATIGMPGQDYSAKADVVSFVRIGNNNIFRECTTIHSGVGENSETTIGDNCMFMNSSHVGHNAKVGNNVILVSGSVLGGHSQIYDRAILSGLVAIHQHCRVGRLVMLSGGSVFSKDVPPFVMAEGRNGGVKMVNVIGLQRAGFSSETIRIIRNLFKIYTAEGVSPSNAIKKMKVELPQIPEVLEFIEFFETSKRGVLGARGDGHRN